MQCLPTLRQLPRPAGASSGSAWRRRRWEASILVFTGEGQWDDASPASQCQRPSVGRRGGRRRAHQPGVVRRGGRRGGGRGERIGGSGRGPDGLVAGRRWYRRRIHSAIKTPSRHHWGQRLDCHVVLEAGKLLHGRLAGWRDGWEGQRSGVEWKGWDWAGQSGRV